MGRLVSCTTLLGLCVACVALDVAAAVEVCGHDRSVPARVALVLDATHLPVAGVLAAFSVILARQFLLVLSRSPSLRGYFLL